MEKYLDIIPTALGLQKTEHYCFGFKFELREGLTEKGNDLSYLIRCDQNGFDTTEVNKLLSKGFWEFGKYKVADGVGKGLDLQTQLRITNIRMAFFYLSCITDRTLHSLCYEFQHVFNIQEYLKLMSSKYGGYDNKQNLQCELIFTLVNNQFIHTDVKLLWLDVHILHMETPVHLFAGSGWISEFANTLLRQREKYYTN